MSGNDTADLAEHRDTLYRRLELGYERIARGLAEGKDVAAWEDFWVALLKEYEAVCDELQAGMTAEETMLGADEARVVELPGMPARRMD